MADPVTRPRHGEPLTADTVADWKYQSQNNAGQPYASKCYALCLEVETLHQSIGALRTERDEANKLLELRGVYECGSIQCPYEVQFRAAEAQRTEAEQALRWITNAVCGVSKGGGPCSQTESEEAIKHAQDVLETLK